MLWVIIKPKATRSRFHAVDVTFDAEEPPKAEDARQATPKKGKYKRKIKKSERRNNCQDRSQSYLSASKDCITANQTIKKQYCPYQACGKLSHNFKRWYLVFGKKKEWISKEARETFRNNMKIPSLKKEVDKVRSGNTNEWRWEDESKAKVKVVGKALALQSYQKSFNNSLILDMTASVHVFHSKERFSNIKRLVRREGL